MASGSDQQGKRRVGFVFLGGKNCEHQIRRVEENGVHVLGTLRRREQDVQRARFVGNQFLSKRFSRSKSTCSSFIITCFDFLSSARDLSDSAFSLEKMCKG